MSLFKIHLRDCQYTVCDNTTIHLYFVKCVHRMCIELKLSFIVVSLYSVIIELLLVAGVQRKHATL